MTMINIAQCRSLHFCQKYHNMETYMNLVKRESGRILSPASFLAANTFRNQRNTMFYNMKSHARRSIVQSMTTEPFRPSRRVLASFVAKGPARFSAPTGLVGPRGLVEPVHIS